MLRQPIGYGLGHPLEILALRKLMVGAGQQLKAFFDPQCFVEPMTLVKGYMFVLVALHDDGRSCDRLGGNIGDQPESIFIEGIVKRDSVGAAHDVRNRVGSLPLGHSVIPEFEL